LKANGEQLRFIERIRALARNLSPDKAQPFIDECERSSSQLMAAGGLSSSSSATDQHVRDSERVLSDSAISPSLLLTSQLQAALDAASARHLEALHWEVTPCLNRVSDVQWADCTCCGQPESVGIINHGPHTLISTHVISHSSLGRVAAVTYGQGPWSDAERDVPPAPVDSMFDLPSQRINSGGVALPSPCSCIYVFLTGFAHTGNTAGDACTMPGIISSLPVRAIQLSEFTLPDEQQSRKQVHQFASTFYCLGWQKTQPGDSSLKLAACSSNLQTHGCCSCIVSVWSFALDQSPCGIRRISEDHFQLPVPSESSIKSIKGQDLIWCSSGMLAVGTELFGPSLRGGCVFLFSITQVDSSGALQLVPHLTFHQTPGQSPIRCLAVTENILLCGVSTRVIAESAPDPKWQPSAKVFAFKIVENGLQQIDGFVVLPASEKMSLVSAPSTVWNVTVEQMIPFESGPNTYIAVSVAMKEIKDDPMPRFGHHRSRVVGDICVFQVGRIQKGDLLQLVRVGEVPLLNQTGFFRVACMALAHHGLSASPTPGEIGWLAYSSVFSHRRGQRRGCCDIWTMRLSSSSAIELVHQRVLNSAAPLHSIALLEPPSLSLDQLCVLGKFDFCDKQTPGNAGRHRAMRANLLCWVDAVCSTPRPLSVFDCAVQCSRDETVTFEDFLEPVTQQPGEQAASLQSLKYIASCRVAIRASTNLAHDSDNCNRGQLICEYLFKNDLANSAPSVRSCIEMFCEKLLFPFKEGRSSGRQRAEHKSTAHILRFYPTVQHGMRKCNVVPLSGFSEFHGAWCVLASTIVRLKNEIALEKLKENKGKSKETKETKDCAACQVTKQGGMVCKLNQKNASEAPVFRPLCLLNCHCEMNCISHPNSVCAQNFLLYLVTSKLPDQLKGKISQNCKLQCFSSSVAVSSGSAVSSADNESEVSPFSSASVPMGHDAYPPLEHDDEFWDIHTPVSPLYSYIPNFGQLSSDCGGDDVGWLDPFEDDPE